MGRGSSATRKCLPACALVLGLAVVSTPITLAQTLSEVYSFNGGSNGGIPLSGLTRDGKGNLYGTTSVGGSGYGTLFELEPAGSSWTFSLLHSFASGADGATPTARLRFGPEGNLYGTTSSGGSSAAGTVFSLASSGESVLYSFLGGSDGSQPSDGDLIFDHEGNIYGTTSYGGATGNGTVFKLVRGKKGKWSEKLLYSFGHGTDGAVPVGGVVFDTTASSLYGTTSDGGTYGYGTVYQLKRSGSVWTETILYSFQDGNDGGTPYAGLIRDKSGNLYGAAVSGGSGQGGTVFELTPGTGGWTFTVLYSIAGWSVSGPFRDLFLDSSGDIYGTTHCDGTYQNGTVYELTPSNGIWTEKWEYDFQTSGGYFLFSNPVVDKKGKVYGTASVGGPYNYGVVFEITP